MFYIPIILGVVFCIYYVFFETWKFHPLSKNTSHKINHNFYLILKFASIFNCDFKAEQ